MRTGTSDSSSGRAARPLTTPRTLLLVALAALTLATLHHASAATAQELASTSTPMHHSHGQSRSPDVSVAGRWASLTHQTSISTPAVIGEVTTVTRTWAIVTMEQRGAHVELSQQVCSIDVNTSSRGVRTIIPSAFLRAIDRSARPAVLRRTDRGYELSVERRLSVLGARLDDPERARLPEHRDDVRVFDHDRDGNPGVTVRVRGIARGDIYLVQRAWSEMTGALVGNDRIEGNVRWGEESSIIGASNPVLRMQPDTRPAESADQNFFRMVRVSDTFSCDDLLSQRERLF